MEDLAARMRARHGNELLRSIKPHGFVPQGSKVTEIAPGSATEIEYRERRLTLDMPQQRLNVLADVVIVRAFPEFFGMLIVVLQREAADFLQVLQRRSKQRPAAAEYAQSLSALTAIPATN